MTDPLPIPSPDTDPQAYWEAVIAAAQQIDGDALREFLRAKAAEADGYENYLAYHELIHGKPPEKHEPISQAFEAHERGVEFIELGFRGSHKTTTFDVTLGSFLHGHHPGKTGIVTGANDGNARLIAKSIAQIIEKHPEFRATFPHVEIYKERGWGAEGYWIRDSRVSVEEWTAQQAKVNDPSFIGGGYKSSEINGKHPSLYLFVDDLHDIDTSKSTTEREYIKAVFLLQILPTVLREGGKLITWVVITGVPFSKDDTYHVLRDGGGCVFVKVPIMVRSEEGVKDAVYIDGVNRDTGAVYEDIVGWWKLTWAENFDVDTILYWRSKGKSTFWQMFMVDIEQARTQGLKYYIYPHDEIGWDLPTAGGADPTSVDPDYEVGGNKRSSFAHAWVCKLIRGGLVLKGGTLKPMGFMKAKDAMLQAQALFANWKTTGVEDVGVGKPFMQFLRNFPDVKFVPSNIIDPKGRINDKRARIEAELAPWLESGVVKISDESTPYLDAVRYGLDNFFELDFKKPHEAIDALDGFYHAVKRFPEVLRESISADISPAGLTERGSLWHPLYGARNG
jgi:hypothetical protein